MLIVVKIGGRVLKEGFSKIVYDVKNALSKAENQMVLVHGGGIEVTRLASKLRKKQEFIVSPKGFRSRYTDSETMEVYTMVMAGKINKHVVSALQREGIQSVGLSGADGLLVRAKRKKKLVILNEGRKRVVDGGYTGAICGVNTQFLRFLMDKGYLPVLAPIAIGEEFELLNVDGDRMAGHVAGALKADKLIFLTDVEGLVLNDEMLQKLNVSEVEKLLPKIGKGMITKVYAAMEAVSLGVGEVVITSGLKKAPISSLLERESGTVITRG